MTPEATEEMPKWPGTIRLGNTAQEFVLEALGSMPGLFFGAAALLVFLTLFDGIATGKWTPDGSVWLREDLQRLPHYASILVAYIIRLGHTVVCACVAVAVHRFILLRESASGLDPLGHRYTWTFVLWAVGLHLLYLPVSIPGPAFLKLLIAVALLVVGLRLSLIFPAVAIKAQSRDLMDRARASWNRTRGKVLLLFLAYFVAVIPFLVVLVVVGLVVAFASMIWSDTHPSLGTDLIDLLLKPVGEVAGTACAAAVASCAYSAALSVESRGVTQP